MIKIEYDGAYPNLCRGRLVVIIDGIRWNFPEYCLSSGGSVWFDDDWNDHVDYGNWSINEYPENFPDNLKQDVITAINNNITQGCCGGCI